VILIGISSLDRHFSPSFPCKLSDGENVKCPFNVRDLAAKLYNSGYRGKINLVGIAKDTTDIEFESKKLEFDIEQWL